MSRRIELFGPINTATAQRVCNQLEDYARADPSADIYMIIQSYGGCVASMLAITSMMERIPCDVVTIVVGTAMSAGAFISVHGTEGKRFSFANAQYMFHEPNGFAELTAKGIESMVWTKDYTTALLAKKTGASITEIEAMIDRDYYVFAHDLIDNPNSFIDGLVGF